MSEPFFNETCRPEETIISSDPFHDDGDSPTLTIQETIQATKSKEEVSSNFLTHKRHENKPLIVLQINAQSLKNKSLEFESFLLLNSNLFHIVCLCEHWLRDNEVASLHFSNYKIASFYARKKHGHGGTLVMIRSDIEYRPLILNGHTAEMDCEISSILVPDFDLIVHSIYRSPSGDLDVFLDSMHRVLSGMDPNRNILVAGDFNVHFGTKDKGVENLEDCFGIYGLKSNFVSPTRGSNCLDNVFTNFLDHVEYSLVDVLCSDHIGIKVTCDLPRLTSHQSRGWKLFRPVTTNGLHAFRALVSQIDWSFITDSLCDTKTKGARLTCLLLDASNLAFPLKRIPLKRKNQNALGIVWYNKHLENMRSTLQLLNDACMMTGCPDALLLRNNYRASYRAALRETRKAANDKYVQDHLSSQSAMWRVINNHKGKSNRSVGPRIDVDVFNKHFTNICHESTELRKNNDPILNLLSSVNSTAPYFSFDAVSVEEVRPILRSLNNSKCTDYYNLNSTILKFASEEMLLPLTHLFNECIATGVYPDEWKIAVVTPIFKKGDDGDPNNYRPISIIPVVSKLFEKILAKQLLHFFETNYFTKAQFGFRSGQSTTKAILELLSSVKKSFEDSEYCVASFLDLSKAFDSVSHPILVRKLYAYNLEPSACRLISSYLSERRQCVRVEGRISDLEHLNIGVPQGSILGPLLFLIYINDLPDAVRGGRAILYADDTTVLSTGSSLESVRNIQAVSLDLTRQWLDSNRLVLNENKTVNMVFSLKSGIEIGTAKFLGVHVDSRLIWADHGSALACRLASSAYLLRILSQYLSRTTLRMAYFSFFHSLMSYGLIAWGHSASRHRIFGLQRRAVRVVAGLTYRADCRESFTALRILTLPSQYIYICIEYLVAAGNVDNTHSCLHNYNTRGRDQLYPTRHRLNRSRDGVSYYAAKFYNALPPSWRSCPANVLMKKVKEFLILNPCFDFDEFLCTIHNVF